jgi:hypothetical protein
VELTEHMGYERRDLEGQNSGNSRNGITTKKLKCEFGEIDLGTCGIAKGVLNRPSRAKGRVDSKLANKRTTA